MPRLDQTTKVLYLCP